jgi:Spy/CpxP family protein refolding chaperone
MRVLYRPLLIAALVAAVACPLSAGDKKNEFKGGKKGAAGLTLPKGIELSADQQAKFKALQDELAPKFAELQKQEDEIMTPARRQTFNDALKKAKAESKTKQEMQEAARAALGLRPEEAAKLKDIGKERSALQKDAKQKLLAFLTDEQKAQLEKKKGDKGKKPAKGDKPAKNAPVQAK